MEEILNLAHWNSRARGVLALPQRLFQSHGTRDRCQGKPSTWALDAHWCLEDNLHHWLEEYGSYGVSVGIQNQEELFWLAWLLHHSNPDALLLFRTTWL